MDVEHILASLTLKQKASLLVGDAFWETHEEPALGVPSLSMNDGPHGLRKQSGSADNLGIGDSVPATAFPTASASACSWDPDLLEEMGRAMGEECRKENVSVILGPGANIKRHPLCGRNFEYFSEDPVLAGNMAAALIRGVQSVGVGASLKHFALNNQEKRRMIGDSVADARALNELYLLPFEIAVRKGHPWTVMGSYNLINGVHATENPWLLTQKLRRQWGFGGAVVTDWGALNQPAESVAAGLDLAMPGPYRGVAREVVDAVRAGKLAPSFVDDAARRMLQLVNRCEKGRSVPYACDYDRHVDLARRVAAQSAVLLENDGILPLAADRSVAVIGAFAKTPRYQGAGSSRINPVKLDCAWDALRAAGVRAEYAAGYRVEAGDTDDALVEEACAVAARNQVAVVFAGLPASFESEGYDRAGMHMPQGHERLIRAVCAANPNTVVVLSGGAPFELYWKKEAAAVGVLEGLPIPRAVLLMYLAGCQSGHAVSDVLLGRVNPSGKLAETWPIRLEDTCLGAGFPDPAREVHYRESLYVGYRYYDSVAADVAYPFGYGLSYTRFSYRNMEVHPRGREFDVSLDVVNEGPLDGAETVQVYVHAKDPSVFMPWQALAAFKKVFVPARGSVRVTLCVGARAFSYWDADEESWRIDECSWEVRVGASSRDIRLRQTVSLIKAQPESGMLGLASVGDGPAACPVDMQVRSRKPVSDTLRKVLAPYYKPRPMGSRSRRSRRSTGGPFPKPSPTCRFRAIRPSGPYR